MEISHLSAAGDARKAPVLEEQGWGAHFQLKDGVPFSSLLCWGVPSGQQGELDLAGHALAEHSFLLVDQLVTCANIYDELVLSRLCIQHILNCSWAVEGASSIT